MASGRTLPTVSLCMIVKNEAENLERCLKSVQGVADELILVDTGSTDQTVELARAQGATVLPHTWQNDFALARNVGLARATGDWILHLDADEELEPGSRPRLKAVLAATASEGVNVCVRNFNPPGALAAYFDSPQARLFRNRPGHRYEQPIHEAIELSIKRLGGQVAQSDLLIWHYGYQVQTVQGEKDRAERNLAILEQAVAQYPEDPGHCARLGFTYYQLGRYEPAYTYLRRALVDLDSRRFTPDFLERVLCTLWHIATVRHEEPLLRQCARALEALPQTLTLSVMATYVLAYTYGREGEQGVQAALQAAESWADALARLQTAYQALQQAQRYFQRLRQHPQLNASSVEKVEQEAQGCQASLAAADEYLRLVRRKLAAEEALGRLLAADDLGQARPQLPAELNLDVLALARSQAKAARAGAAPARAARLEALAGQLEQAWQRAAEAPGGGA